MPGERYFAVRDRLSELLGWVGDLTHEVALEAEPEHPQPVLTQPVLIAAILSTAPVRSTASPSNNLRGTDGP